LSTQFELDDINAEELVELFKEKNFEMKKQKKELPEAVVLVTSFQGKTYSLYEPVYSYEDAKLLASTLPTGRLVRIESAAEDDFLQSWLPAEKHYWLGATDQAQEGVWTWEGNSTPFWTSAGGASHDAFSAWAVGEPNNADNVQPENCALLLGGSPGWVDRPCDEKHQLIVVSDASAQQAHSEL